MLNIFYSGKWKLTLMRYHHECTKSFKTDIICNIFTEYNSSIKRMNYDTFENIKNKCVRIREKSSDSIYMKF